jgi:signal peptidase II
MPGVLGNLSDRVIHPSEGVVDFIKMDFYFWPFNPWPTYNIADAYITAGLLLIIIDIFFQDKI